MDGDQVFQLKQAFIILEYMVILQVYTLLLYQQSEIEQTSHK